MHFWKLYQSHTTCWRPSHGQHLLPLLGQVNVRTSCDNSMAPDPTFVCRMLLGSQFQHPAKIHSYSFCVSWQEETQYHYSTLPYQQCNKFTKATKFGTGFRHILPTVISNNSKINLWFLVPVLRKWIPLINIMCPTTTIISIIVIVIILSNHSYLPDITCHHSLQMIYGNTNILSKWSNPGVGWSI